MAYGVLRAHTASHQNAFFDLIDRALNGPNADRDSQALALLAEWLGRPRRDPMVDLHGVVAVCGDQACQPVPAPLRPPTDFLWQRSPFQLAGGGSGIIEGAGIDYILPYWMTRYYGVSAAFVVQSSAAASFAIAPDSIASIYGSNLAPTTAQAAALPLPLSLGGISLTVQDAAGVTRSVPLIYASPAQINLVVPNGTAPGAATFSISNGGGAPLTLPPRFKMWRPRCLPWRETAWELRLPLLSRHRRLTRNRNRPFPFSSAALRDASRRRSPWE